MTIAFAGDDEVRWRGARGGGRLRNSPVFVFVCLVPIFKAAMCIYLCLCACVCVCVSAYQCSLFSLY